jgi:hypothetical protein
VAAAGRLEGITERQYGHSLVVAGTGAGSFFSLFTWRISRKITNATTMKSRTVLRNAP